MAWKGRRSFREEPWHYCSRCGTRRHMSQLAWQRGLLLCVNTPENCYDTGNDGYPLTGQREQAIAESFEQPTQELMPDPKLTDEGMIEASMDDIIY